MLCVSKVGKERSLKKIVSREDLKMKRVLAVLFLVAALATGSQAADISALFNNIDFDSGPVTDGMLAGFHGFDAPCTEIPGWTNDRNGAPGLLNDSGVEGTGAWWLSAAYTAVYQNAGFMSSGDAAYTMSTYTIQAGDVFDIQYMAGVWGWTGSNGQWTASLFYDNPANVIGSYVQDVNAWMPDEHWYSSTTGIAATSASVGHTLGILMTNTGTSHVQIDEITVNTVPEPATLILLGSGLGLGSLVMFRKRK
jgi:hypothetical protein